MDFNELKYGKLLTDVKDHYEKTADGDWEKIRNDEKFKNFINMAKDYFYGGLEEFDVNRDWDLLINYLKESTKKYEVTKLAKDIENDAEKPSGPYNTWTLYKNSLEEKKWSENSIQQIEDTSFDILKKLNISSNDTKNINGPVHGLVMGSVQSGKTANMTGLMAMAADNGINCFIVLTGVIENLREQTANRLVNDLTFGKNILNWKSVTNPSPSDRSAQQNISKFSLGNTDKDRFIIATLKNKKRLEDLYSWLTSDKNKAKQLKILLIDDEADQASINTKDIDSEEYTAINEIIRKIVNYKNFGSMNYVAYTATPFANILNETVSGSLYPSEFMEVLTPAENYIGPEDIFGTEIPEEAPAVDIVEEISEQDKELIKESQDNEVKLSVSQMPISLKKSIDWFLLSVASLRALYYDEPLTMLIHTSFKVSDHERMEKMVIAYLKCLRSSFAEKEPSLKLLYFEEKERLNKDIFLKAKPNYANPEEVPDYPEWNKVRHQLTLLVNLVEDNFVTHVQLTDGVANYGNGIHIAVDNSHAKDTDEESVRLLYPEKKEQYADYAPAFIVIGGNTLSRGLTLKGLVCTYFLRTTNQADTLMQMGRWFGFRQGYEIFPRVWMDRLAMERYTFLSQMNTELRDEMSLYATQKFSPLEYAPKIKSNANHQFIRITSKNKMQSAQSMEFNFQGYNVQTYIFPNSAEKLSENLQLTSKFLNGLNKPIVNQSRLVWNDVNLVDVQQYLENYNVIEDNAKLRAIPEMLKWLKKNSDNIDSWNIVLAGKIDEKNLDPQLSDGFLNDYNTVKVTRSKKKEFVNDKYINIGVLRSPSDLIADIDENSLEDKDKITAKNSKVSKINMIRNKYGVGKKPLLIIYRVDKNSKPNKNNKHRQDLNAPCDLIGWSILIPGETRGSSFETYKSNNIKSIEDPENVDDEEVY